ncbi:stonustoxin subunit alpha-like [Labeo rohita]|uniref:stonustoxin subunit alpha-like n=1 Tax=Labeo rohita TaxID=84645 RepID=UPI0021E2E17D|nr:stonustoxin subunit alpha-like [Labeo rohita]
MDLSNNDLQDSGVKLLSDGLKSPNCQLQILRFPLCNLTAQSCESLSSVLQSLNSCLRELDLSNNDLQDLGVKLLSHGLTINCNLKILRLSGCMVTSEGCDYLLSSNPSHLRELDLSYNNPGESGVKLLSEKLKNLDKLNMDHGEEYRITAGLKKYSRQFTLDLNTVYKQLHLSENNRVITCTNNTNYPYPDHPDRFERREAMCRESVSGRCYWELEWRGDVYISVSYKSISRKGQGYESGLGDSDQSWCLFCTPFSYSFIHNNTQTDLPAKPISCRRGVFNADAENVYLRVVGRDYDNIYRIGVFVDHRAGTLSFYCVSDTVSLIHAVQTTFTQPLYPEIGFYSPGSSVKLC